MYTHDFNSKEIKIFNIFNHGRFLEDVKKGLKKYETKEEFAERLRGHLFYYYASKCEWEVVITDWPTHITVEELNRLQKELDGHTAAYGHPPYALTVDLRVAEKIDVYDQIMLNWDIFINYLWENLR